MLDVDEICDGLADIVGEVTGGVYGAGATLATGNVGYGAAVGTTIDNFVSNNWEHVCDLPENTGLSSDPAVDSMSESSLFGDVF